MNANTATLGVFLMLGIGSELILRHNRKKLNKSVKNISKITNKLEQDLYCRQVIEEGERVCDTTLELEAYCAMQGVRLVN